MKTYAIADLHGRFDLLLGAYGAIIEDAGENSMATIIHLGDYVDRGPQSREIMESLMDERNVPPMMQRIVLKGNHEDIMVQCLRGKAQMSWWFANGGAHTMISYGQTIGAIADPSVVPEAHLEWIDKLPMIFVDQLRIFVHAAVDPTKPLGEQTESTLLWQLYPDGFAGGYGNLHVVHGHHQFADGPKVFDGRTDLDTFAWKTGRLVVGVFDSDQPGGAVKFLDVRKAPIR